MTYSVTDTLWVFLAAILVFFMNLGFAAVEAGFARAKNTVNILSKNFIVFAVSSLGFLLLGSRTCPSMTIPSPRPCPSGGSSSSSWCSAGLLPPSCPVR